MHNPLDSKRGRLITFFLLYMTEGIPQGFAVGAVVTYMRRGGLSPAQIGSYMAIALMPWAFKWAVGPFVDVIYSDRFGRRRLWILACQVGMIASLLICMDVDYQSSLGLFTALMIVNNIFGATQDVAIDALAIATLREEERGLANGLMFSGAYAGNAIGSSGVLFLTPLVGFKSTYLFVAAALALIMITVTWRLRETASARAATDDQISPLRRAAGDIQRYALTAVRSMFANRSALAGFAFALLPAGAFALTLALQSNLCVELGLSDHQIATMGLVSTIILATCCVLGGFLSDLLGRRRMIALYIAATLIPTLILAWAMHHHHWIMPIDVKAPNRPVPPGALVVMLWVTTLVFSVFHGLLYGTRTALFMDVCNPAVAATQFTAYMALLNAVISYSAKWQGAAVEKWGYPITLLMDALFGLLCLAFLPFMRPVRRQETEASVEREPQTAIA